MNATDVVTGRDRERDTPTYESAMYS